MCCCNSTNRGLVICLLVSSIILFVFEIIYIAVYPWDWLWDVDYLKAFCILRIIFAAVCLGTTILMIVLRNKGDNRHKEKPFITVEKALSICCLIFSILTIISNFIGNIVSSIKLNTNSLEGNCLYDCESYYEGGYKAKLCGGKTPYLTGCRKFSGSNSDADEIRDKCGKVFLCYEDESGGVDPLMEFFNKTIVSVIMGYAIGIYWIVMIVNWAYMVKYVNKGNPDSFASEVQPNVVYVVPNQQGVIQPQYIQGEPAVYTPQGQYTPQQQIPYTQPEQQYVSPTGMNIESARKVDEKAH